jgi:hypothetical protein
MGAAAQSHAPVQTLTLAAAYPFAYSYHTMLGTVAPHAAVRQK